MLRFRWQNCIPMETNERATPKGLENCLACFEKWQCIDVYNVVRGLSALTLCVVYSFPRSAFFKDLAHGGFGSLRELCFSINGEFPHAKEVFKRGLIEQPRLLSVSCSLILGPLLCDGSDLRSKHVHDHTHAHQRCHYARTDVESAFISCFLDEADGPK